MAGFKLGVTLDWDDSIKGDYGFWIRCGAFPTAHLRISSSLDSVLVCQPAGAHGDWSEESTVRREGLRWKELDWEHCQWVSTSKQAANFQIHAQIMKISRLWKTRLTNWYKCCKVVQAAGTQHPKSGWRSAKRGVNCGCDPYRRTNSSSEDTRNRMMILEATADSILKRVRRRSIKKTKTGEEGCREGDEKRLWREEGGTDGNKVKDYINRFWRTDTGNTEWELTNNDVRKLGIFRPLLSDMFASFFLHKREKYKERDGHSL